MALYYGKHKVRDFETWRRYFESDQGRINSIGAKLANIMRSVEDPNEVHYLFDVPDFEAFMSLMQTPDTQEIMQRAGVLEMPMLYRLHAMVPEGASANI